jgi:CDP-diacylglycerol---glycerol-3-phosphate 3-phosphatidyltransferase
MPLAGHLVLWIGVESAGRILSWRKSIPWMLVGLRACLGPVCAWTAWAVAKAEPWLGAMIFAGFVSDVYDGILARRWGTETARLRVADTAVDTVFYLGVLTAVILRHGGELRARLWLVVAVLAMEAIRLGFDFLKYGRSASYHAYSAKIWGVLLAAAALAVLCFDRAYWLMTLALVWGLANEVEGFIMSLMLPEWTYNVKSLFRAAELRRVQLASRKGQVA